MSGKNNNIKTFGLADKVTYYEKRQENPNLSPKQRAYARKRLKTLNKKVEHNFNQLLNRHRIKINK